MVVHLLASEEMDNSNYVICVCFLSTFLLNSCHQLRDLLFKPKQLYTSLDIADASLWPASQT